MFSYFPTIFSKAEICTSNTFSQVCVSTPVLTTLQAIRAVKAREAKADNEKDRKVLHERAANLKKKLPSFCFQATFKDGRRKQESAVLNGLVMLDFDNVANPKEQAGKWKAAGLYEKLGIMLVHITPSGTGLRVVARCDAGRGNLADNQRYLAGELGLPNDEAVKDAARLSFAVGFEDILYIDEKIFDYNDPDYDRQFGDQYRGGSSAGTTPKETPVVTSLSAGKAPTDYRGISYDQIISQWWAEHDGEPKEGERNVKLFALASNLRYICDNRPSLLQQVMPSYGLAPEEMRVICEHACKERMYRSIPRALHKVLSTLGCYIDEAEQDDRDIDADFNMRLQALVMPQFFKEVMALAPQHAEIGALLASLPMIYTLASRITFTFYDGVETRLSGMTFIVGPAASGKSFILKLDKLLMEPIRLADKAGRQVEQEYRDAKELNKNKKEQLAKPHPVIRITPIQISNTMLAQRMRDAVDTVDSSLHLHVYSCEAELATALRAQRGGSWIEKNDIYCKSFHNELWGMDYANDQSVNGEVEVNLNLVISGTEDAFNKLIPTSTVLSGLPTRLMYFPMPINHYSMVSKGTHRISSSAKTLIKDYAYYLDAVRGHVDVQRLTDYMYDWCTRMATRAEMEDDEELDDLRKRTALIGVRAGVVYALIAHREEYSRGKGLTIDEGALAFAEFIADYCLYSQYRKFAEKMRNQKAMVAQEVGVLRKPMRLISIYNNLPDKFSLTDVEEISKFNSPDTVRKRVYRWVQKGYVKKDHHKYVKVIQKF